MALTTYTELVAAIASWTHRTDLATVTPDFIALAEARIKTLLTARLQDTTATITTVAGVATASLSSTLLRIHALSIATLMPSIDYLSPGALSAKYVDGETGTPRNYTTVGDLVHFGPVPDAVYSVTASYQAAVPALTADAPTNSLLTKWPHVYLFGALVESIEYTRNEASRAGWESKFQTAIAGVNLLDWHTGGPMRVRSDVRM